MFAGFGRISSAPTGQKKGWFFISVDEELGEYYKWFYSKGGKSWNDCMNGCHITFIAGEKDDRIVDVRELNDYINQDIEFYYENTIWTNGRAFWLPAISPELDNIRAKLNLRKKINFHITLGNIK